MPRSCNMPSPLGKSMRPKTGLDEKPGDKVPEEVKGRRRRREYPFPKFAASELEKSRDKLHYPPRGSPDFLATEKS